MSANTLRHKFKLLFASWSTRIRGGPIQGMKWSVATGSRFVKGTYEPYISDLLVNELKPGMTYVDIGTHVGYFVAVAAKLVGPTGRVVAFEPRDVNLALLRRHVAWNKLDHVTVVPSCVGDTVGFITFDATTGTGTGRISATGNVTLPITTLDTYSSEHGGFVPDFVKIDVEGAEVQVLKGAQKVFAQRRTRFLIATHGEQEFLGTEKFLKENGYAWKWIDQLTPPYGGDLLAWPA